MRRGPRWLFAAALGVAAGAPPAAAAAAGPWTTWMRAFTYADLAVEGDAVWCATLEAGLLRFSRATAQFQPFVREPRGLAANRVGAIAFDRSGRLWAGTLGAGASVLSADRSTWGLVNVFDGLPSDSVVALEADGDTVWIGTTRGIALWNGREVFGTFPAAGSPSPFASDHVSGIAVLGDSLWVATLDGVYFSRSSGNLSVWTQVSAGLRTRRVEALAFDGRSLLALDSLRAYVLDAAEARWRLAGDIGDVRRLSDDHGVIAASSRRGIFRWNGAAWDTVDAALVSRGPASRDFAAAADPTGRFVAANLDGLFEQPDGPGPWRQSFPPSVPGNNLMNLALDGSTAYVASRSDGIGRYDGERWRYWFRTGGAVVESDTTFRDPAEVFAMLVSRTGRKWIACWDAAVEEFDDRGPQPRFTHHFPVTRPVITTDTMRVHTYAWTAAQDSNGGHWFGMDTWNPEDFPAIGLEFYDSAGVYRANYRPGAAPLRSAKIHALTVSPDGRVWIGYAGQGIDHFQPPASPGDALDVRHVGGTDNLDVQGMVAHGDRVWVMTTADVRRYSLAGALEATFVLPGSPSPLATKPLAVAADGAAWAGTVNGIRVYRPDGTTRDITTRNSPLADDEVRAIEIERRTGVVWIATAGGLNRFDPGFVPPPPPRLPRLDVTLYPNPARLSALGIGLRLSGNASGYRGEIHDLGGRVVRRFAADADRRVIWDGRDPEGNLVKPGIYFVRVRAGGRSATVRVALVR